MDYEAYILNCLKDRLGDQAWHRRVLCATLGLTSAAMELVAAMQPWDCGDSTLGRQSLLRRVERLEFYRALTYYQLDLRPAPSPPSEPTPPPVPTVQATLGLAVQAGRVASLASEWIFHGQQIEQRARVAMAAFESSRRAIYDTLAIDDDVWLSCSPRVTNSGDEPQDQVSPVPMVMQ